MTLAEDVAGAGALGDLTQTAEDLVGGQWLDAGLHGLAGGAGLVAAAVNPLASIVSWGVSWLIDNMDPLKSWFDDFAGDHVAVLALGESWAGVAGDVAAVTEDFRRAVADDMDGMQGALVAYAESAGRFADRADGVANACRAAGSAIAWSADVVHVVHDVVRDAISDVVGMIAAALVDLSWSLGAAAPKVAADVARKVAELAARLGPKVAALIDTLDSLTTLLTRADELIGRVGDDFAEMIRGIKTGAGPRGQADQLGLFTTVLDPFLPGEPARPAL
jgi:hypothetical protein